MNGISRTPSRRQMLHTAVGAGALCALSARVGAQPRPPADLSRLTPQLKTVRDALFSRTKDLVDPDRLKRKDGYLYTVDAAQLMVVFAEAGELTGYTALREFAEKHLIIDDRNESYTRGFVAWRWKPQARPDASGTTEALRLARALWLGAKVFSRPSDLETALKILDGYARHATVDQQIWIIRNYYNFATRCFANNSFLVDYDADFLKEVADERKDPALAKLAEASYGVVKSAVAPSGLLYDLIQPEMATLYPELNLAAFSPNDVIQFSNCCTTAITVTAGLPEVGRKVLAIAMNRLADLHAYYVGNTAEPFTAKRASVSEYSILVRLALRLGADQAAATIAERAMNDWNWCAEHLDPGQVFTLTEILQAMHALLGPGRG